MDAFFPFFFLPTSLSLKISGDDYDYYYFSLQHPYLSICEFFILFSLQTSLSFVNG